MSHQEPTTTVVVDAVATLFVRFSILPSPDTSWPHIERQLCEPPWSTLTRITEAKRYDLQWREVALSPAVAHVVQ